MCSTNNLFCITLLHHQVAEKLVLWCFFCIDKEPVPFQAFSRETESDWLNRASMEGATRELTAKQQDDLCTQR